MEFTTSTTATGSATGSAISGEMNIQPETVISSVPTLRRERGSDYGMFEPDFELDVYNWFHYANNERRMLMIDQLNNMILHDRIMSQSPIVEDTQAFTRPVFSKPMLSRTMSVRPGVVEDEEGEYFTSPTLSSPILSRTMSVRPAMVEDEEGEYFTPPALSRPMLSRTMSVRPGMAENEEEREYFTPPALSRNMSSVAPIFDYDSDDMPGLVSCTE